MKGKTYEDLIQNINWKELSKQKMSLLYAIKDYEAKEPLSSKARNHRFNLEGILSLIDNLQDCAVDNYGVKESTVFPILEKIRLINKANQNKN